MEHINYAPEANPHGMACGFTILNSFEFYFIRGRVFVKVERISYVRMEKG
jgi:hypothetical protein